MKRKVGMVGIGLMGHGIALNIVNKGWPLRFLNHSGNQPTEDLINKGARVYEDPLKLSQDSDIIILCVNGTPQVESLLLGTNGMLSVIKKGTTIIDCSTAIPSSTEQISRQVESLGGEFIDAAMTRTPYEARQGRLNLLIGGKPKVFESVENLLKTFAENIFYAGPAGSGHKLKLIHNFVSLGFATLLSEAAACANKGNISAETLVDVLKKGGGYGAALDRIAPFITDGDVSRMKFSISNALKDVNYYNTMAQELGSSTTIARSLMETIKSLHDAGLGEEYIASASKHLNEVNK